MKVYETSKIRNIALAGHVGSGKTSLTEAMLYLLKQTDRLGKTDDGTTVSDFDPEEQRRHCSIQASLIPIEHNDCKINLIDLPGARDFIGEIKRGLRAADSMLLVLDATSGVDTGAEFAWQYAKDMNLPVLAFVNKLDKENCSFESTVAAMHDNLGTRVVRLALPIDEGLNFKGVIDLLKMKKVNIDGQKFTYEDIPAELADEANAARAELVEIAAEGDEELMMKFLDDQPLSQEEVLKGLGEVIAERTVVPVLCGTAAGCLGMRPLLDLIVNCMPDPTHGNTYEYTVGGKEDDVKEMKVSNDGSAVAYVFKTVADPFVGKLSFFKLLRGSIKADANMTNVKYEKTERLAHIMVCRGKKGEDVPELYAGDIAAVAKAESVHTDDTLVEMGSEGISVVRTTLPKPTCLMSVTAKTRSDEDKVGIGFHRLIEQDPSLSVKRDPMINQTILSGHGETHLATAVARLKDMAKVEVNLEVPRVPYRETITKKGEGQGKHKKQSGGHGQYGDCWIRFEPLPEGSGFQFEWAIVGGVIPTNYQSAIEKGLQESMANGVLSGSQTVDVKAACYDGSYHAVDSSDMAFKVAASLAFKNIMPKCGPVIMEPIYKATITIPESYMGDVMGDLNSRRGRILGMNPTGDKQVIETLVPLSELYTYSRQLNSLTQGRGMFEMEFDHYERVPNDVQEKIIAETKARREAEEA